MGKQHLQKKNWTLAAMFALSLSLSACGGGGGGSSASGSDGNTNGGTQTPSVTVSSSVSTVAAGDGSVQLSAQITGSTSAVTWSISPAGIGSLDSTSGTQVKYIPPLAGTVLADTPVTITASAGQISKSVSLTVQRAAGVALLAGDYGRMVDGPVSISKQYRPGSAVVSSKGNLYVVNDGSVIRKISPDGSVSTLAGSIFAGTPKDGTGSDARFGSLGHLVITADETLYAIDESDTTIKKITPDGVVSTIAGPNKPNSNERFNRIASLVVTKDGSVIFSDAVLDDSYINFYVPPISTYRIKNGAVELLNMKTQFNIVAMAMDGRNGDIYGLESVFGGLVKLQITDNNVQVQPLLKLRGKGMSGLDYTDLTVDSKGRIYIASASENKVFSIDAAMNLSVLISIPLISAESMTSYQDGSLSIAKFSDVNGLAVDAENNLYLTEFYNATVRKITAAGVVTTFSGSPYSGFRSGLATEARFSYLYGLALDATGNIFMSDSYFNAIYKLDKNGNVQVVAGGNVVGAFADGMGGSAKFNQPKGLYVNAEGSVLVADSSNNLIRKVDANQKVTTLAGVPTLQGNENGSTTVASFTFPSSVIQDKSGSIYVGQQDAIRKIGPDGQVSIVAGGHQYYDYSGKKPVLVYPDGKALNAGLGRVYGMTTDSKANLVFADCASNRIRKLSTNGDVTTIAGSPSGERGKVDGNGTNARFFCPRAVVADELDNLYVMDNRGEVIRKITPQGDVTTLVGNGSYLTSVGKLPANLTGISGLAYDKSSRSLLVTAESALFRVVLP
ncbi:NHL domain-containing protein [Undibacterium curvum]|uniref:Teneurin NHL domain-containing protein n=1 Tax=Undibacterium curvum TaxID=2762294 RepID=A0ABR7A887_9BURK|nr:hypothetical protein [Undibacterium curvum]MBC3933115.1 hypothetical protein [Undibacterium curvum]